MARLTATARGKLLLRIADLIAARADALGAIETTDNGKLILEMRGADALLARVVPLFRGPRRQARRPSDPDRPTGLLQLHSRGAAGRDRGDRAVELAADARRWKMAPALAAGNTFVMEAFRALVGVRARDGRYLRGSRLSARRREHRDRLRARDRRHAGRAPATSRRSRSPAETRPARTSIRRPRGTSSPSRWSSAASPRTSCSRTRDARQRGQGRRCPASSPRPVRRASRARAR